MATRKSRERPKVAGKPAIKPSRKRQTRAPATPVQPHAATPNMGWYADDQTGYQIARDTADRQRRFTAAQSSGVSAPPLSTAVVSNAVVDPPTVPISATAATLMGEVAMRSEAVVISSAQYEKVRSQIAVLERLITELPKQPPGIGHNRPPISEEEVGEITEAIAILKVQPVVPTAPDEARAAASTLKRTGERLGAYLDTFLSEAAKSAGKEFGKRLVQLSYWYALAHTLMGVVQSVSAWLH
jgi:hypothetical protein